MYTGLRFYYTHEILDAIATNSEESSLDPALSKSIDLKKQTPIAIELHNGDLSVSVAAEDGIWLEYRVEDIFAVRTKKTETSFT